MSAVETPSAIAQVAQNGIFEWFARAGFAVSGLLHLVIGYIAIRIALGGRGGNADQSGALAELASKPGGTLALWAAGAAFLVMAMWRLAETVLGRSTEPKSQGTSMELFDRATALSLAVVYVVLAFSTFEFAWGGGKSSGQQNADISARLMASTIGTVALVVVGLIIVAVGAYHVYEGASSKFLGDLKGVSSTLVRRLGTVGYIAKGLVIAGAGVLVVVAMTKPLALRAPVSSWWSQASPRNRRRRPDSTGLSRCWERNPSVRRF